MKKLSLQLLHRLFSAASWLLLAGLLGFLAYLYVAFSGPLIGDADVDAAPGVLTRLDTRKLQAATARMETRSHLPDVPADLTDPYNPARADIVPSPAP